MSSRKAAHPNILLSKTRRTAEKRKELKETKEKSPVSSQTKSKLDLNRSFRNTPVGYHFQQKHSPEKQQGKRAEKDNKSRKSPCRCRTAHTRRGRGHFGFRVVSECPFCCKLCDFRSRSEDKVKKHVEEKHKFRCEKCRKIFRSQEESTVHYFDYHEPKRVCGVCNGRVFKNGRSYEAHVKTDIHRACEAAEKRGADYLKSLLNLDLPAVEAPTLNLSKVPEILRTRNDGKGLIIHGSDLIDNLEKSVSVSMPTTPAGLTVGVPMIGLTPFGKPLETPGRMRERALRAMGKRTPSAKTPKSQLAVGRPTCSEQVAERAVENFVYSCSPNSRSVMRNLVFGSPNAGTETDGGFPTTGGEEYRPNLDEFPADDTAANFQTEGSESTPILTEGYEYGFSPLTATAEGTAIAGICSYNDFDDIIDLT